MTEEERYLFDLQGYLLVPNAIEPETVRRLNAWCDQAAESDTRFRGQTGNAHLEPLLPLHPDFRVLLDNPRILPYLHALMGENIRLDHDYAIFLQPGHTGLNLHGPNATPFDPNHYYRCYNGQMFNGLTVATYALTDVTPGAGGLAVIPGSHKSNFPCPREIRHFKRPSPIVQQVPVKAGDCVLFTEALVHGTLPWQGPDVRRTLFYKYAPSCLAWSNRAYFPNPPLADTSDWRSDLTAAQRKLLVPPAARDFYKEPTS